MHLPEGMTYKRQLSRRLTNVKIKQCDLDVYKYLVDNNIDYTVNKDGVFFNVTILSDNAILDINEILKQHELTNA